MQVLITDDRAEHEKDPIQRRKFRHITFPALRPTVVVVLVLTTVLAGLTVRRGTAGGTLGRVAGVLAAVLVTAYVVAVWAMTTKPD